MILIIKRYISNVRDGHHLSSKYWQDWKKSQPDLSPYLMEIAIAMVLSDATIARVSREAYIKFEQGYIQKDFLFHLFELFKSYCFMLQPGTRIDKTSHRAGEIKSYWFKTFSHPTFSTIWDLFIVDGVKTIRPGLILDHMTGLGLAYWVMSDGSLASLKRGGAMVLHTQSFTLEENIMLSNELNKKFGLSSRVIKHKNIYSVIQIPRTDAALLRSLIEPHIIPSMAYKIPKS